MKLSRSARRRLGLLAALAPAYYVTVSALATLLAGRRYSSVRQTMSEMASPGARHPRVISAGFIGYGLLVQGLGPLLHRAAGGGWRGALLWALVGVYGAGGLVAGLFHVDSARRVAPRVDEHAVHGIAGRAGFSAVLALTLLAPALVRDRRGLRGWRAFSWAMFTATCALALPFESPLRRFRGVYQRGFFLTTMAWVFATALRLRR